MAELGSGPVTLDGIGTGGCTPEALLKFANGFIPALESQQYDTFAEFNDEDVTKAAIVAGELLPIGTSEEAENTSTEELTSETSTGTKIFHRNGKYGFIQKRLLTPDQNRILLSYDQKIKAGYLMDDLGNRLGTSPDGTVVKPLTVSYFKVKPMELPLAADGISYAVIEVQFEYWEELNKQPVYSISDELDWIPKKVIKPMTKITVTPSAVSAFAFTCSFAYVDPTTGKSVPLNNLSADGSELTILDQTGNTLANITVAAVAGSEGDYTITDGDSGLISGSITLNAAVDSLWYSDLTVLEA